MVYTLDQFAADCRAALLRDAGRPGRERVRQFTERRRTPIGTLLPGTSAPAWMRNARFFTRIPTSISAYLATSIRAPKLALLTLLARLRPPP